jgi:hypothetical protein
LPRLDFKSLVIAFVAELGTDEVVQYLLFYLVAPELPADGATDEQRTQFVKLVLETTAYRPWAFVLGMITTVLGGYVAARMAQRIPYYHGLAMGIVGVVFMLATWDESATGYEYVGLLITIPASIFGAHFARRYVIQSQSAG